MVKFINTCAQIEEMAAKVYHEFSRNSHCDAELAAIWRKMARDEEDHAHQLRLVLRLSANEILDNINDKCPNPDELSTRLEQILKEARQGNQELLDMLKVAVVLEKEFRRVHVAAALVFKDQHLLKMFEMLAAADDVHVEDLQLYIKRYRELYLND